MTRSVLMMFLLLILAHPAAATSLSQYKFDTPEQDQAFKDVIEQMRCLVCQNESLAGSNAELATDLRNEIYSMMKSGQDKNDIISFMVERYGDFVLYDPPLKPSTYPLWFGPLLLFAIGAIVLIRNLRKKDRGREVEISTTEQERLKELLKDSSDKQDSES